MQDGPSNNHNRVIFTYKIHIVYKKEFYMIHVVTQGETVYSIAELYGVSAERIRYDNQLNESAGLTPGQALLILYVQTAHTVRGGETLETIAAMYNVSVRQLLRNNPYLVHQPYLVSGQNIVIRYEDSDKKAMKVTGYAYPFIEPYILKEVLLYIEELLVFSYGFTMDGELIPPFADETWMIREAENAGVRPILVLTPFTEQGTFNNQLVTAAVEDLEMQERLIENVFAVMQEKGYVGVDIDFEYILAQDRVGYAEFVRRFRERLAPEGYQVSVALVPKTSAEQRGLLYEGMDYRLLGEAADYVFLMTYEWGYTYSEPMAVAPIDKVRQVLDYAVTEIPVEKIIMGVPNYGYDWTLPYERGVTRARLLGNVEAANLAVFHGVPILFDETAQSPHFNYQYEGYDHEVWFEDVRSIEVKIRTAQEYNFAGFGYWNLMRPFRANWLLVNQMVI